MGSKKSATKVVISSPNGKWSEKSKTTSKSAVLTRDSKSGRFLEASPKSKRILRDSAETHREALERLAKR